ncbi:MAG: hypothetical protein HYX75_13765 [Acidobacteria bacterium]|nr:hypothetical protein [Acidobacteriota bacterium]
MPFADNKNRRQPLFLYLHFREPHFGGYPPKEFLDKFDPLLCECGGTLKLIDVIEARTQSDVVGEILKHINFVFEALPPPPPHPDPGGAQDDGSLPDAYCF